MLFGKIRNLSDKTDWFLSFKNYYEKIHNSPIKNISNEIPFIFDCNCLVLRFKSILDVRDGTHESPKYYETGLPFLTSKNLTNRGVLDYSDYKFIKQEDFEKYNMRSNAEENDILFGMIGSIGKPVIVKSPPFKFAFKNMALIKNYSSYLKIDYIWYYLLWLGDSLKENANGGVQKFVSLDYIRNIFLIIPSLERQSKIIKKIKGVFNQLNFMNDF